MGTDIVRILIVDDHAVVRKGLAMVLRLEDDFEVVGEASNGKEALRLAEDLNPDLILLDLIMPEMNGKTTAQELDKHFPKIKKIILTGTEVNQFAADFADIGIDGYIFKEIEPAELKKAIRVVNSGESYIHPSVLRILLRQEEKAESESRQITLTPRESEVIQWFATSNTYREIAQELNVTEETIRSHAKNILHKLNQPNRAQAVLAAIRSGLIELSEI